MFLHPWVGTESVSAVVYEELKEVIRPTRLSSSNSIIHKTLLLRPLQSRTGLNLQVDKTTTHSIESSEIQIP